MSNKFSIDEIKNYISSQDSLGDVLYNLTEDNIYKANRVSFVTEMEALLEDFNIGEAEKLSLAVHQIESGGNDLTLDEEVLWRKLTVKIQQHYL